MSIAHGWRRRSGKIWLVICGGLGAALAGGGCQTARYHGASPSARYFNECPRQVHEFYVGMNFNWSLEQPGAYHHAASPTVVATAAE